MSDYAELVDVLRANRPLNFASFVRVMADNDIPIAIAQQDELVVVLHSHEQRGVPRQIIVLGKERLDTDRTVLHKIAPQQLIERQSYLLSCMLST